MIKGKVYVVGRDIDTDVIIPARYLTTFDPDELGKHCFEDLDENFSAKINPGDVIIAGENFGCGSSREHAPIAIKGAGVAAVVAESFARIFLRNAINTGLPVFEVPGISSEFNTGDEIAIDPDTGVIKNLTTGKEFKAAPLPEFVRGIIEAGGLVAYARKRLEGSV